MARASRCELVRSGQVKRKGRASIEFYLAGKPQYFCMGYMNPYYDDVCEECLRCPMHVRKANDELQRLRRRGANE